jgi:MoaA/NifB/PqqE/SkfB family radical SAM enzyme
MGTPGRSVVIGPVKSLILTVTRACNLRCSYCPTVKDGWPSLSPADAVSSLDLFATRFGGGDVKLFGGEPLLVPDVVRAVFEAASARPAIRRVYLSTNGLGLDDSWIEFLRTQSKAILTVSLDGEPADNRRFRHALPGVPDAYDHVIGLLPRLLALPRLVVTQTIPPASAGRASANFRHLRALGFHRFNLLPGYYLPWRDDQLAELRRELGLIHDFVVACWDRSEPLYLRNLFTVAPTPFFNTGLVVDADRAIHPSNVGLSGQLDGLRGRTQAGTLDDPPAPDVLEAKALEINGLLAEVLPPGIWRATRAVDGELTRLCRRLLAEYLARRRGVRAA